MTERKTFSLVEICDLTGLDPQRLTVWIERRWLVPAGETALDEEDLARVRLIEDLQRDFGANDEAVPIILHLVDQLCFLEERVRRLTRGAA